MKIYTADYIENYGGQYYNADEVDAVIAELVEMIKRGINENTSHYSSTWNFDARDLIDRVR